MIVTGHQIEAWLMGILATTIANILTFLFFTSITSTNWFKRLLVKLTDDFNNIVKAQRLKDQQGR